MAYRNSLYSALYSNVKEAFKKLLDPDPEPGHLQNLMESKLGQVQLKFWLVKF